MPVNTVTAKIAGAPISGLIGSAANFARTLSVKSHARDVLKRTWANGEKMTKASLTDDTILVMRLLHSSGWSQRRIANLFLVSGPCVCNIVNGKRWKHVTDQPSPDSLP